MTDYNKPNASRSQAPAMNRREALAGLATAAAGSTLATESSAQTTAVPQVKNPYGGGPNTGITLPPYYRPTPSVANANTFFPGMEDLGADEMRISFVGSSPVPPTRSQAGTAIMVELGNGKRFFFDLGPGCLRNIVALQVPLQMVNDIFITHPATSFYAGWAVGRMNRRFTLLSPVTRCRI